ncbi:MAG: hypothetical protein JKY98_09865 [Gammaproteobacteria bacterium]|nr:hypothetical protein [Gammaproteobacteria bacterium]
MGIMRYLFILLVTVTLITCTSTGVRKSVAERLLEKGLELGESNSRIPRYRVNGWSSLDDRNLIITAGVNDKYLVRFHTDCFGLTSAFYIGFTTPTTGLDRFSRIIVRGPGRRKELCNIEDIVRLHPIEE